MLVSIFTLVVAAPNWHLSGITLVGNGIDADTDGSGGAQVCTDQGRIYKYVGTGSGTWEQLYQTSSSYIIRAIDLQSSSVGWSGGTVSGLPGTCVFREQASAWTQYTDTFSVNGIYDLDFYSQFQGWSAGGDIMRWNGGTWTSQTPAGLSGAVYLGISNAGFDFARAVGYLGGAGICIKYNGTLWTQDTNIPGGTGWLNCVQLLSSTDGWAAGANGRILRFDGANWVAVTSPYTTTYWRRMWFVNSNDGWLVGDGGYIAHWNGTSWLGVTSPTTQSIYAVVFFDSNNGWAFGNGGVVLHYYDDSAVENTSLGCIKASFSH